MQQFFDLKDAIALIQRELPRINEDAACYAVLAAALARLGRLEEAREAAQETLRLYPFFDAATFASNMAGKAEARRLIEGLNAAGLD